MHLRPDCFTSMNLLSQPQNGIIAHCSRMGCHGMRDCRRQRGFVLSLLVVVLFGIGSNASFAKCGGGRVELFWRYASIPELISWDGSLTAPSTTVIDEGRHQFDLDGREIPCTVCRCRNEDEQSPLNGVPVARSVVSHLLACDKIGFVVRATPPNFRVSLIDCFCDSSNLSVLERPPQY